MWGIQVETTWAVRSNWKKLMKYIHTYRLLIQYGLL